MINLLKFTYLSSITFWIGSIFFFSFFAAPSIFKVLPRNLAGDVVADIFPKYYLVSYICGFLVLLTLLVMRIKGIESNLQINNLKILIVGLMLGLSIYSGLVLRPQVAEVKTEIRSLQENSPGYVTLNNKFKKLHMKSAIINLAVFIFGITFIFITAYNCRLS